MAGKKRRNAVTRGGKNLKNGKNLKKEKWWLGATASDLLASGLSEIRGLRWRTHLRQVADI